MTTHTRPATNPGITFTYQQNEDGQPHFAYYAQPQLLSFIWDGQSAQIQVCHGGYGEPVQWVFDVPPAARTARVPVAVLAAFRKACDDWLLTEWQNLP